MLGVRPSPSVRAKFIQSETLRSERVVAVVSRNEDTSVAEADDISPPVPCGVTHKANVFLDAPDAGIVAIILDDEASDGVIGIAEDYDTVLSETNDIGGSDSPDGDYRKSQTV